MSGVTLLTVPDDDDGMRLDRWVRRRYPALTQGVLQKLLRKGNIRVEGKRAEANTRLSAGQQVRLPPLDADAPKGPRAAPQIDPTDLAFLDALVLWRDADVAVLNKPAGLPVQGGSGVGRNLDDLLKAWGEGETRPKLVHRLDRDTSGCLVVGLNDFAVRKLAAAFRGRDTRKYYWAITAGVPEPRQGRIESEMGKQADGEGERVRSGAGKRAMTDYRVIEIAHRRAAFVALWPRTGRTHQLRVHMADQGTPILGDGKYGGEAARLPGAEIEDGALHLHARRLILPHPRRGVIDVTAPIGGALLETMRYFDFAQEDGDPFLNLD